MGKGRSRGKPCGGPPAWLPESAAPAMRLWEEEHISRSHPEPRGTSGCPISALPGFQEPSPLGLLAGDLWVRWGLEESWCLVHLGFTVLPGPQVPTQRSAQVGQEDLCLRRRFGTLEGRLGRQTGSSPGWPGSCITFSKASPPGDPGDTRGPTFNVQSPQGCSRVTLPDCGFFEL